MITHTQLFTGTLHTVYADYRVSTYTLQTSIKIFESTLRIQGIKNFCMVHTLSF
jgi:hypothetical protein